MANNVLSGPVQGGERIEMLDVLRGFALFGILVVNMPLYHTPIVTILTGQHGFTGAADMASLALIRFLFESKFFPLFSALFGYGFWLFLSRRRAAGASAVPVYLRRLAVLLLFGAAHVVLLWAGDILFFYAVLGFILVLFRNAGDRTLLWWAGGLIAVPVALMGLFTLSMAAAAMDPHAHAEAQAQITAHAEQVNALIAEARQVYRSGSFAEMTAMRLREWRELLPGVLFFYPNVLAMFLVGAWAARRNLVGDPAAHEGLLRRTLVVGVALGVPANALYAWTMATGDWVTPNVSTLAATAAIAVGGPAFAFAFVSAWLLWAKRPTVQKLRGLLAPLGRMALSQYLLQSLVCTTIFYGYGFGLYGRVKVWQGVVLTAVLFALQVVLARWWMARFRFGPLEWLWRTATYWRIQPIRRRPTQQEPAGS